MELILGIILLFGIISQPTAGNAIPADAIKGDFNGDGKPEYIWIIKPKLSADGMSCVGSCMARLVSSNPHIQPLELKNSIGGKLTNLGDLNNDCKDDIGLLPDWFTSCWRSYITYTLKGGKWTYLVQPFMTHCNQWEANVKPLEKIPGKPGYLKENYSDFVDNDIVVKSKIVKAN